MKFLLLGKNGMLGTEINKLLKDNYDLTAWDKEELDITNRSAVLKAIDNLQPQIVINAAAYTDVDGAEKNFELAKAINGDAVGYLAESCEKIEATLIHISTDYVFNGTKVEGYDEDDQRDPINKYGLSKALGEEEIQKKLKKYFIIRTAWLYGKNGKNFVETMLKLAKNNKELKVVNDQHGCPTYAVDLAKALKLFFDKKEYGIYHLTNEGATTWFKFAQEIFKIRKINVSIKPVTSNEFPRPAKRPEWGILKNNKMKGVMRRWEEGLQEYLISKS